LYSIEIPDYFTQVVKMVLTFDGDTLVTISGDYIPKSAETESDDTATEPEGPGAEVPANEDTTPLS
jgi:hypothetical protein